MRYAVEMASGAVIYIPSFVKIGSGIQKLIGKIQRHTESMVILCFLLFFNKESRLKNIFSE
jgi:hypothetical protein